jgi:hypothetical protein
MRLAVRGEDLTERAPDRAGQRDVPPAAPGRRDVIASIRF